MTYTVVMVSQDSLNSECIGAGTEDFKTLKEAQFFARLMLPNFDGDHDQIFIEFQGPSDFVPQEIEVIKEVHW